MTLFDVLIVLALAGGTAIGFIRGMVQQILGLVYIYISIALAILLYQPIGSVFGFISGGALSPSAMHSLGFVTVLLLAVTTFGFMGREWHKSLEHPIIARVNNLGGLIFGFITACVWISLAITLLSFAAQTPWSSPTRSGFTLAEAPPWEGLRLFVANQLTSSPLVAVFADLLPYIFATLRPLSPGGLPDILKVEL